MPQPKLRAMLAIVIDAIWLVPAAVAVVAVDCTRHYHHHHRHEATKYPFESNISMTSNEDP